LANSTQIRQGIDGFFRKRGPDVVRNTIFTMMPVFEILVSQNGSNKDGIGLGRPGSAALYAGANTRARRLGVTNEREYYPMIMTEAGAINDGDERSMSDRDFSPTVGDWEDKAPLNAFQEPRTRFVRRKRALKVPHTDIFTAQEGSSGSAEGQSAKAIRSPYEVEHQRKLATFCKGWNAMLWGAHPDFTSGAPTNEDLKTWDCLHSFKNAIHDSNTYMGVDRGLADNAYYRGHRTTTARGASIENLLNEVYYDFGIYGQGGGPDLVVTGAKLFQLFKKEIDQKRLRVTTDAIPAQPQGGFKREVICIGFGGKMIYVIYDPTCPQTLNADGTLSSGEVYFFDLSTWTLAIHPRWNFNLTPWTPQDTREGGDEADVAYLNASLLLVCEIPSWNAVYTAVS
jgi:hypothetical protein